MDESTDEARTEEGRAAIQRSLDWQDNSSADTDRDA